MLLTALPALWWPQDKTPHDEWLCALEAKHGKGKITAHDVWPKTCDGAEVLLRADYGACGYLDRPCRYLVTLREPMSRLVSEYQCARPLSNQSRHR